jgi:hypothetical protein
MRLASCALIAVLLISSASAIVTSGKSACCCEVKAGASCPMQSHEADGCTASCGLRQAQPFAGTMPPANDHPPALLGADLDRFPPVATTGFEPRAMGSDSRAALPPDPPPPRHA